MLFAALLLAALLPACAAEASDKPLVRIGVLANRGLQAVEPQWRGLTEGLSEALPDMQFRLVPLGFDQVAEAVARQEIDYLVTNPAIDVLLEARANAVRIATVVNQVDTRATASFGGVIFTRAGRTDISSFADFKGKRLAAAAAGSIGGWQLGLYTMLLAGFDPRQECASVTFFNSHDTVVAAVLEGEADVGIVRTDTLERMVGKGLLDMADVAVVTPVGFRRDASFPFVYSTPLIPEWPIAKLAHTPEAQARTVAAALLTLPRGPSTADGGLWTVPLPLESVHTIMRELKVPPYEDHGRVSVWEFTRQHMVLVLALVVLMVALVLAAIYYLMLNARLQAALTRLREAESELIVRANTDILTGLFNRRHFSERVDLEIGKALRYNRPLAMILLDIDHFKRINDTYGHPVGDDVLHNVARLLQHAVRKSDMTARIGGEEFAVLLPETALDAALAFAERVRSQVEETTLVQAAGQDVACTVSIGVAEVCASIQSYSTLYNAVDEALYKAKKAGRNKTMASDFCRLARA